MATLVNRAYVSTATTGTGTLTLGAAEAGFQDFAAAGVANGDVVRYTIVDGTDWEIGTGTYSSTGPTLSRQPTESSNSGNALNLSGAAKVFITATADDLPPSTAPSVLATAQNSGFTSQTYVDIVQGGLSAFASAKLEDATYGELYGSAVIDTAGTNITQAAVNTSTTSVTFTVASSIKDDFLTLWNGSNVRYFYTYDSVNYANYYGIQGTDATGTNTYYRLNSLRGTATSSDNGNGTWDVVVTYNFINGSGSDTLDPNRTLGNLPIAIGGDMNFGFLWPDNTVRVTDTAIAEAILPTVGVGAFRNYKPITADGVYAGDRYGIRGSTITRTADGYLNGVSVFGTEPFGRAFFEGATGTVNFWTSPTTNRVDSNTLTAMPELNFVGMYTGEIFPKPLIMDIQFDGSTPKFRFDASQLYNVPAPAGLVLDTYDLIGFDDNSFTWAQWGTGSYPSINSVYNTTYQIGDTGMSQMYTKANFSSSAWQMRNSIIGGYQHGTWGSPVETGLSTIYFDNTIYMGYRLGRERFDFNDRPTYLINSFDSVVFGSYGGGAGDTFNSLGSSVYFIDYVGIGTSNAEANTFSFTSIPSQGAYLETVAIGKDNVKNSTLSGGAYGYRQSQGVGIANLVGITGEYVDRTTAFGGHNVHTVNVGSGVLRDNTAVGSYNFRQLSTANTTAESNTAVGFGNMYSFGNSAHGTLSFNTAVGYQNFAFCSGSGGSVRHNAVLGSLLAYGDTIPTGMNIENNVLVGTNIDLPSAGTAYSNNVAIGNGAGAGPNVGSTSSATQNVAIGIAAGASAGDGTNAAINSTFIGAYAGSYAAFASNVTCLGAGATVTGNDQLQLGNTSTTVYAQSAVQTRSDERDKADIRDTVLGLNFIEKLRPVDFRWDMRDDYFEDVEITETWEEDEQRPNPQYLPPEARFVEVANPDYIAPADRFVEVDNPDWHPAADVTVEKTIRVPMEDYAGGEDKTIFKPMDIPDGDIRLQEYITETVTKESTRIERRAIPNDGSKKRTRFHHGLIAQDVEALIAETGVDFGGFQDHSVNGGKDVQSIGYTELVGPLIKAVQELSARVKELETQLAGG